MSSHYIIASVYHERAVLFYCIGISLFFGVLCGFYLLDMNDHTLTTALQIKSFCSRGFSCNDLGLYLDGYRVEIRSVAWFVITLSVGSVASFVGTEWFYRRCRSIIDS